MPFAPGTFGTLAALPLAYSVRGFPDFFRALFWLALFLGGTWAAQNFDELCETQDNQNIVIDEVIGLGITAWTASDHWQTWMAAFLAFRLFDVLKPPPIRQIDRWSHRKGSVASSPLHSGYWTRYAGGFGVMVDDLIAGVEALIVILVLQKLGILP
jgi:phosphatidylglycerophosphatase A